MLFLSSFISLENYGVIWRVKKILLSPFTDGRLLGEIGELNYYDKMIAGI